MAKAKRSKSILTDNSFEFLQNYINKLRLYFIFALNGRYKPPFDLYCSRYHWLLRAHKHLTRVLGSIRRELHGVP